jgi:hypothetical protein
MYMCICIYNNPRSPVVAQAVSHRLLTTAARVDPRYVGYVVAKGTMGHFFSKHYGFPR